MPSIIEVKGKSLRDSLRQSPQGEEGGGAQRAGQDCALLSCRAGACLLHRTHPPWRLLQEITQPAVTAKTNGEKWGTLATNGLFLLSGLRDHALSLLKLGVSAEPG